MMRLCGCSCVNCGHELSSAQILKTRYSIHPAQFVQGGRLKMDHLHLQRMYVNVRGPEKGLALGGQPSFWQRDASWLFGAS